MITYFKVSNLRIFQNNLSVPKWIHLMCNFTGNKLAVSTRNRILHISYIEMTLTPSTPHYPNPLLGNYSQESSFHFLSLTTVIFQTVEIKQIPSHQCLLKV